MIIETNTDPTGSLNLAVEQSDHGELSIGFLGFAWHTHPELLVGRYGPTAEAALDAFIRAVTQDEIVIAVVRLDRQIVDVAVCFDPTTENIQLSDGEVLELRYWSGRHWAIDNVRRE